MPAAAAKRLSADRQRVADIDAKLRPHTDVEAKYKEAQREYAVQTKAIAELTSRIGDLEAKRSDAYRSQMVASKDIRRYERSKYRNMPDEMKFQQFRSIIQSLPEVGAAAATGEEGPLFALMRAAQDAMQQLTSFAMPVVEVRDDDSQGTHKPAGFGASTPIGASASGSSQSERQPPRVALPSPATLPQVIKVPAENQPLPLRPP